MIFKIIREKDKIINIKNIYMMKYSTIRNNEVMSFAITWMDLEIVILSEVRERKTNIILLIHGILKNVTNELSYKTKTQPQMKKINMITGGRGKLGDWG